MTDDVTLVLLLFNFFLSIFLPFTFASLNVGGFAFQ